MPTTYITTTSIDNGESDNIFGSDAAARDALVQDSITTTPVPTSLTHHELKLLATVPKVSAGLSLLCAAVMAYFAWQSRHKVYHRLTLGMSIHIMLLAMWQFIGPAAMPSHTAADLGWGVHGNQATCTAQGVGMQVHAFSALFYYVGLSIYSYEAVRHNFITSCYAWIEPWIHGGVHVFPVLSAMVLVYLQAFNPGNTACWIDSYPIGCGGRGDQDDDSYVPCVRGPDNILAVAGGGAGLPTFYL